MFYVLNYLYYYYHNQAKLRKSYYYSNLKLDVLLISWSLFISLQFLLGVCRKPTDSPNPIQSNPTRWVGSVFKAWWVGLGYKKNFYSRSGWVWVIKLQTRQTWPDLPIFNMYLKYIIYLIIFFLKSAVGHLYIYIIFNN